MTGSEPPLLRLEGITKAYPGVVANDDVSIELRAGEIHSILGENGAGKTTLMGILYGQHQPDSGRILIDGREVRLRTPRDALASGIGYVQQHFSLIPTLTVAENLVLSLRGDESGTKVRGSAQRVRELSRKFDIEVEPDARVEDLSVGQQQRAELLKALAREMRILILDEPSSVLTPQESDDLFSILKRLAAADIGIFLISHKLDEVLRVSDRFSVLRRGRLVATLPRHEVDRGSLATMMIGALAERTTHHARSSRSLGAVRLEARDLSVASDRGDLGLQGFSFQVRAGEILGVAGVEGSGQVELTESLAGLRRPAHGQILIDGKIVTRFSPRSVRDAGVAHVPADRSTRGTIMTLTVAEELILPAVTRAPFSRFGLLDRQRISTEAESLVSEFDIRTSGVDNLVGALSGGNQQKVILAREMRADPGVIVACYPTRGLDFASTEAIERQIVARSEEGAAVLYVSTDLDELLGLSDRIIVIAHGRLTGELKTADATAERLGLLMGGSRA